MIDTRLHGVYMAVFFYSPCETAEYHGHVLEKPNTLSYCSPTKTRSTGLASKSKRFILNQQQRNINGHVMSNVAANLLIIGVIKIIRRL